jgi:nitrogen fixation protein NifB
MCNFCNRKYDCVNESRPGVTSTVLTPGQALAYVDKTFDRRDDITVIGIAGPGDPFANPEETMETIRLVRAKYPEVILCLSSNGLGIGPYIDELAELKVTHVTITICAVDPKIAAKVYAWGRENRKIYRGEAVGELMVGRQLDAVKRICEAGMICKVNTIIIPGVNEDHIPEVAKTVADLGAEVQNCIPMIPVEGAVFHDYPAPDGKMTSKVRFQSGEHIRQMLHCARCRSDAVGLLGKDNPEETQRLMQSCASLPVNPSENRPNVAVASMEGMLVNLHLGEAGQFHVFEQTESGSFKHIGIRLAPPAGGGDTRWDTMAKTFHDCRALLVNAAGDTPKQALMKSGIQVIEMEGLIEEGLECVYSGRPIPKTLQKRFTSCGDGCKGTGTGCD